MKKLALLLIMFVLTACASDKGAKKPEVEVKKETPLWKIVSYYRQPGENPVDFEDKWFVYKLELAYIKDGQRFSSPVFSACPVGEARYTVWDRESGEMLSQEIIPQVPCDPCHKR